ncbi:MAG: tetratricopeptide repeat protein [Bacteroidales bacterium]|nr:MAG: tetratricopeptide repeat protein [Bacteroidales bacterium]
MIIKRSIVTGIIILLYFLPGYPQIRLFNRQDLLDQIRAGIDHIYNYEFEAASSQFDEVEKVIPWHPVIPFLRGFQIYWEANPITPYDERSDLFVSYMEESISIAQSITEENEDDIEAVFFDLASNAILLLYYADNGETGKVLSRAGYTYRLIKKGFILQEEFPEFCFFTGVYNYYRVVYPEIHPIYKPISLLFPPGDKEYGWDLLTWIKQNSVFLRAEAMYFMSHIAMSMEDDPGLSQEFTSEVLTIFPQNNFFRVRHLLGLNSAGKYREMEQHVNILLKQEVNDQFALMAAFIFRGVMEEKLHRDYISAREYYREGLKICEKYGVRAGNYAATANLGISRIYKLQGNNRRSREYWKKARSLAKYDYILKDR